MTATIELTERSKKEDACTVGVIQGCDDTESYLRKLDNIKLDLVAIDHLDQIITKGGDQDACSIALKSYKKAVIEKFNEIVKFLS